MADQVETPEEKIARLERELGEAQGIISEQSEKLAESEVRLVGTLPVVTHKQQQYQVVVPKFNHKGTDYTAETLAGAPDLVKELVESGSGILAKVEKAKK